MALTCNIDSRGKRVRLINGMIALAVGLILLLAWAMRVQSVISWAVVAFLILVGGFMVFEARAGWCAVRAMGFKTKI